MIIQLPKGVNSIINILIEHGYEAYAVGGCIRDSVLGLEPEDWDITTSAEPEVVKEIFKKTIDTGIQHGTVTVFFNNNSYEVTTYRIDGKYEDGRHPSSVEFTSKLAHDLQRRDFTVNAMAYNEQDSLVDLYNGMDDLEKGIIKCVGNPIHRFEEDALRILRAFRFSAQLNFQIEEKTYKAACLQKENLNNISAERIRTELNKLLISPHPEKLLDVYRAGITGVVFPEFDLMMESPHIEIKEESVGNYAIKTIQAIEDKTFDEEKVYLSIKDKLITRLTLLLHEVDVKNNGENSSDMTRKVLKRLKFDNETIYKTASLIDNIKKPFILSDYGIRKAINNLGSDLIEVLFIVKEARLKAFNDFDYEQRLDDVKEAWLIYKQIINRGDCTHLRNLKVDGKDLINLGYKPGKELGKTLNQLLDMVLEDQSLNEKSQLLTIAKEYLDNTNSK